MRCEELEQWLAARMGDGAEETSGATDLSDRAILGHLRSCERCASLEDLVRWLKLPEEARAPVDEPDPDYWESFPDRVIQALDAQASEGRARSWWAPAAAMLLLAVGVAGWSLFRDGAGGTRLQRSSSVAEAMPDVIERASPDAAAAALEAFAEAVDPASYESYALPEPWVEDTAELDDETRREILEWLKSFETGEKGGPA